MNFNTFLLWERSSLDTIDFKKIYVDMADGDLVAGLMLSQLVYWNIPNSNGNSKLRVEKDGHLWIVKRNDDWWDECRIKSKQAIRALEKLKECGLVVVEVFKFDGAPTNHIRIDHDKFLEVWNSTIEDPDDPNCPNGQMQLPPSDQSRIAQIGNSNCPNRYKPQTETTSKNTEYNHSPSRTPDVVRESPGFALPGEEPPKSTGRITKFVNRLYDALSKRNKITRKPSLIQWESSVKSWICSSDVITIEALESALDWYENHIGEDFVPKAYSAESFCDKLVGIQEARDRWKREYDNEETSGSSYNSTMPKIKVVADTRTEEEFRAFLEAHDTPLG